MLNLLLLIALQDLEPAKSVDEAEAKKRVEEFRKAVKGAKDDAVEAAMRKLAESKHPLILKELLEWAGKSYGPRKVVAAGGAPSLEAFEEVKMNLVAAECVAATFAGDADAAKGLTDVVVKRLSKRPAKGSIAESDLESEAAVMIQHVAEIGSRACARALAPYLKDPLNGVAEAALEAAAELKSKDLVEPLIAALAAGEATKELDLDDMPDGMGVVEDRKSMLIDGAQAALKATTGQEHADSKAWKRWWGENRDAFKEPEK